jgi:hypothetical protein
MPLLSRRIDMSRVKQASQRSKAIPILGAAGLSLTLTSGVSVAAGSTSDAPARDAAVRQEMTLGDVPCLRQRKSSRQAARVWLWWRLLPVRASAVVCARKRYLFAPTASPDWKGAQTCSEISLNSRRCGGRTNPQTGPPARFSKIVWHICLPI